jgi:ubiquinone/menaquinone biosynthesis C-methylase UbiE
MNGNDDDAALSDFVARWCKAALDKDVQAADAMRSDDYRMTHPGGGILSKREDLDLLADPGLRLQRYEALNLRIERKGRAAKLRYDCAASGEHSGDMFDQVTPCVLAVRRNGDAWQATSFEFTLAERAPEPATAQETLFSRLRRLPQRVAGRLRRYSTATFQDVAYLPYQPGEDILVPAREEARPAGELPIPPEHLWLGYNYPLHGARHVRAMLDICEASGFQLARGQRVLDLGCGAGRMIRHLEPYAEGANIWGLDISAEHILWCKRNLSPPFHFATNTKVPHLPFEDRSFDLVYCGSVFTHIDDLADLWLLELRRVLSPDGRLFVTIHDEHTMALLDGVYKVSPLASLRRHPLYAQARAPEGFSMLAVGRDNLSQIFYDREEFLKMAAPSFDVLSVTEEAYFYQTAVLLQRR